MTSLRESGYDITASRPCTDVRVMARITPWANRHWGRSRGSARGWRREPLLRSKHPFEV
jgi:hypothetical protein